MKARTEWSLKDINRYVARHGILLIPFEKGQRKEDLAAEYVAGHYGADAILFIGKAQEKVRTFLTKGRRNARGETYPWIVESRRVVPSSVWQSCADHSRSSWALASA